MHSAFSDEKNSVKGRKFHFKAFHFYLLYACVHVCLCVYKHCIPKDNSRNSWVTRGNKCKRCGSQDDKRRKPKEYTWRQKKTREKNTKEKLIEGEGEREGECGRGRVVEWASKKATKWNEMTKYVYDKQWKIHNEFEKDKCKWSEVDSSSLFFYQEFLLLYAQRAFYIILYISAHCWAWNSIKWPVSRYSREKKCKQRNNEGKKERRTEQK